LTDEFVGVFLGQPTSGPAIKKGLATKEDEQWHKDFATWRDSPGAFGGFLWCEGIGRKP